MYFRVLYLHLCRVMSLVFLLREEIFVYLRSKDLTGMRRWGCCHPLFFFLLLSGQMLSRKAVPGFIVQNIFISFSMKYLIPVRPDPSKCLHYEKSAVRYIFLSKYISLVVVILFLVLVFVIFVLVS